MFLFDLARILVAGVVLGLIVGKLVLRSPYQIERLRPRYWCASIRKMKRRQWVKLFTVALWVAAASLVISSVVGVLLQQAGIQVVSPEEYPFTSMERDYPLLVLLAVNILPIFEEWVFRGVIIDEMIRWRRSKFLAVVVSALLFTVFHLSNPGTYPALVVSMLPASLLLGVCYLYTGLGGAIVAHNSYNTFLVIVGALMR
ncbi:MAG: CPBP family intramembrane glutamic endopeptidase [Methanobacteriota archaeon]